MNWKIRLALWLGRRAGVDLRPWDNSLDFAKSQIEALTLALEKVRVGYAEEALARRKAEDALRKLAEGKQVLAPDAVWNLVGEARKLATSIERKLAPGTSGEYKRHVVLAEMKKIFPTARAGDIALAIELALRSDAEA